MRIVLASFSMTLVFTSVLAFDSFEACAQTDRDSSASSDNQIQQVQGSTLPIGIEKKRPDSGRFVKIENGYMVPYEATIPGTEVKYTMVPIRGGKFMLGSPKTEVGRGKDEGPQIEVTVQPFWMGKHEVTWAEFKKFMDLCKEFRQLQLRGLRNANPDVDIDAVAAPSMLYDPSYTFSAGEGDDQPAATMTHFSAKQYTKWLSLISETFYRLPTESEWEYACRAGTTTAYYFGDDPADLKEHAWYYENANEERHAVGKLAPNTWGLYDMHGNVAEWVLDAYNEKGYSHLESGKTVTSEQAFAVPLAKQSRVARGGTFESDPAACRSAARMGSTKEWAMCDPNLPQSPWWYTDSPATGVGFRLIRPLKQPASLDAKNSFWEDDSESLRDARHRVEMEGRGAIGKVDPKLPGVLLKLKKLNKKK